MRTLHWIRRDLRVEDNTALLHAAREAGEDAVVAVYAVTPSQWREHDEAPAKIHFWLENLRAMSGRLAELGVPVRILTVDDFEAVPAALLALARELEAVSLHANTEYEVNERRRDRAVEASFAVDGRQAVFHADRTALEPDAVRTQQGGPYSVFTPYKRAWIERAKHADLSVLPTIETRTHPGLPSDPVPESVDGFDFSSARGDLWIAGEAEAHARLDRFVESRARAYSDQRDLPGTNGTSLLSPYLAAGVISVRQCLAAARAANQNRFDKGQKGLDTWISELIWREFYTQVLVAWPRVCMGRAFRPELDERVAWSSDRAALEAWKEGRTGYPLVDGAMRQLKQTGWMHNRLRMVAAMFLTKHLLVDWREGERHFMQHLVDGDLAANNGGWQWSASVGTDAAPYFRVFNPMSQSERFDPEGRFIHRFVPEMEGVTGKALHDPRRLGELERRQRGLPGLIVDPKQGREQAIAAFKAASN